jgi:tetratricopeptide (TPR) repeat protein
MTLEGRWDDAGKALRLGIDRARRSGDSRRAAALLVELARVTADRSAYHRRDPEGVHAALEAARSAARAAADAHVSAEFAQCAGQVRYWEAFGNGDWGTPRELFGAALEGRRRAGDRRGEAESLFYLGLTFEQAGEKPPAMERYQASLGISEEIGDLALQSYAHRHIGGLLEEQGSLDAAYAHIARSVELRRQSRFFAALPFALMQQADFLAQHRGDRAGAMRLLEEAIDAAHRAGSIRALSGARLALAALALETDEPGAALSLARCGLKTARRFGDREVVEDAEKRLSDVRRRLAS